MEYNNIELKYIESIIPSILRKKLKDNNILRIIDIINLSVDQFSSFHSIGKKTVLQFIELKDKVKSNQHELITLFESTREKSIPREGSSNLLLFFKSFIDDFFNAFNKPQKKEIFIKRFGLKVDKKYTLEDIGVYFDITRERVRQIEFECLSKIKFLYTGSPDKKLNIIINEELKEKIKEIEEILKDNKIFLFKEAYTFLTSYLGEIDNFENSKNYLKLFITTLDFSIINFKDRLVCIWNGLNLNKERLVEASDYIESILHKDLKPIQFFDIVIEVKRKFARRNINNDLIKTALYINPSIECINYNNEDSYQINFTDLRSLANIAYRILFEKKESIHSRQLIQIIAQKFEEEKKYINANERSLCNQMSADSRFSPIGKTGIWTLTEWGENTDSIGELVTRALNFYSKPLSIDEIFEYAQKLRPNLTYQSVQGTVSYNSQLFSFLEDNTIILNTWIPDYKKSIRKKQSKVTDIDFIEILSKIYKNKSSQFSIDDLLKELVLNGIDWKRQNLMLRISKSPFLTQTIDNGIQFDISKVEHRSLSKFSEIKYALFDELNAFDGHKPLLSTLVNKLNQKYDYLKQTVYKVISENPEFIKTQLDGKIYLSVKKDLKQQENTIKKSTTKLYSDIKKGENQIVEFKSSLRFDKKELKLNLELEYVVIKAIAGFLNAQGGTLIIGVDDDSNILGLGDDYSTLKKNNRDGFLLHFNNLLNKHFNKDIMTLLQIQIEILDNFEICKIAVKRSTSPIFIKEKKGGDEKFYVRISASTQLLNIRETANYVKSNF